VARRRNGGIGMCRAEVLRQAEERMKITLTYLRESMFTVAHILGG